MTPDAARAYDMLDTLTAEARRLGGERDKPDYGLVPELIVAEKILSDAGVCVYDLGEDRAILMGRMKTAYLDGERELRDLIQRAWTAGIPVERYQPIPPEDRWPVLAPLYAERRRRVQGVYEWRDERPGRDGMMRIDTAEHLRRVGEQIAAALA